MIDDAMLGTLLELHGHDSSRFDETTAAGVVVLPLDEIDGRFGAFCLAKDPRSGAVTLAAALQALQDELSTPGVQMALMALALPPPFCCCVSLFLSLSFPSLLRRLQPFSAVECARADSACGGRCCPQPRGFRRVGRWLRSMTGWRSLLPTSPPPMSL